MYFCTNLLKTRLNYYVLCICYSKISSRNPDVVRYVQKQLKDEYSKLARMHDYRARSAFKLLKINEKYKIVKKGKL